MVGCMPGQKFRGVSWSPGSTLSLSANPSGSNGAAELLQLGLWFAAGVAGNEMHHFMAAYGTPAPDFLLGFTPLAFDFP